MVFDGDEDGSDEELLVADDGRCAPGADEENRRAEIVNGDADLVPRSPHGVWNRDPLLECCCVLAAQEKLVAILTAVRQVLFCAEENRLVVLFEFGIGRLPEPLCGRCPVIDESFGKDLDLGI